MISLAELMKMLAAACFAGGLFGALFFFIQFNVVLGDLGDRVRDLCGQREVEWKLPRSRNIGSYLATDRLYSETDTRDIRAAKVALRAHFDAADKFILRSALCMIVGISVGVVLLICVGVVLPAIGR